MTAMTRSLSTPPRRDGIRVTLDLRAGHVRELVSRAADGRFAPLHTAPWIDEPEIIEDETIPRLRYLSGDFFCAPFSTSDVEPAPAHGWPANAPWRHVRTKSHSAGGAVVGAPSRSR
jgi:hypothetical protein